jgi:chromate transporter
MEANIIPDPNQRRTTLRELAGLFTRLGFTAFGGPAAHVALMEHEVVTRRGWLDRQHFLDLIAAVNFIPGPNSTQLAILVGQMRAGMRGLIVAGTCFIAPAMLIILPIGWAYVKWGALPQAQPPLRAIGAAIVAVVVFAIWRFGHTAVKDKFTLVLMIACAAEHGAGTRLYWPEPELIALALAALLGAIWYGAKASRVTPMVMIALPIGFWPQLLRMAGVLFKIGATLFGSGYVLVSYLQTDMVDHRAWLTQQQLLDAIAVGQFTPGPLLTTATFVGYLLGSTTFGGGTAGGLIGGLVGTIAIFLPSFILVAIFGPMLQQIRQKPWARGALDGMNAAVVGLMVVPTVRLAGLAIIKPSSKTDLLGILILLATLFGLWRRINTTWLVLGAGLVGLLFHSIVP